MPGYNSTNYNTSDLSWNYCRNPYHANDSDKAKTIWCATADPNVPWEQCLPVGVIQPVCTYGYAVSNVTMRDVLWYGSFVVWVAGILWVLLIVCLASRIRLAIALNKVAAVFLANNPHIVLVPVVQALLTIAWTIGWLFCASFLLSQVPQNYTPTDYYETYTEAYGTTSSCAAWEFGSQCAATPGKCTNKWPSGAVWKDPNCIIEAGITKCWRCSPPRYVLDWRFWVSFFMYLWNSAFNVAMGQILVAMAVCVWFFTREKGKRSVVPGALKTVFRYHLGSVLFGSFIVAVIQFIRYLMAYFEKQAQAQKNRVMVLVLKILQCCIWCFEKCVQFLNKNAYIQIALLGKPFCTSAKKAFFLILRNALRFGTVAVLGNIIHGIGFLCIISGTTVSGYFIVRAMHADVSPVVPLILYACVSYLVASLYMDVFGLAVDTSLQCFLAVEESGSGQDTVPSALKNFVARKVDHTKPDTEEPDTKETAEKSGGKE